MRFERIDPSVELTDFVREYWIAESPDTTSRQQKIVPDGCCEIIFHYGAPYRINLQGKWETQARTLLAGQISRHFFLENSGASGMLGLKLRPTAAHRLFGQPMDRLTDRVVDLREFTDREHPVISKQVQPGIETARRVELVEEWILDLVAQTRTPDPIRVSRAVEIVLEEKGMVDIASLSDRLHVSRRHLERQFKMVVGLTPKLFSRIIRFNHIFEVMKTGDRSWIDIALRSGHFDQSHFIRSFKAFTGEEPSRYGFDEENLANFFLKKDPG